ncbi:MAG: hypothetical protein AB1757_29405 [Acidobacteriota bacterium]
MSDAVIQVAQDLVHQQREWMIERIGWLLMSLLVLAALVGLLGTGPLSDAMVRDANSTLEAEYRRFARYQAPTVLRIHLSSQPATDAITRLSINRDFIDRIELQRIDPEPVRVEVTARQFIYNFQISNPPQSLTITLRYKPDTYGRLPIKLTTDEGARLAFTPFIYP